VLHGRADVRQSWWANRDQVALQQPAHPCMPDLVMLRARTAGGGVVAGRVTRQLASHDHNCGPEHHGLMMFGQPLVRGRWPTGHAVAELAR